MINWLSLGNRFWFSLWQSCLCVGLCLLLGGGLALLENKLKAKSSKIFLALMTLPVYLPGVIVATGFIIIYGNNGILNDILNFLHLADIQILYTPAAIILGHVYYNLPLAYLALHNRLYSLHNYLEEAGAVCGASPLQIFLKITWPRIKNTALGVALLIFIYCFLSFSLPLILGGIKYQTIEVYIYNLITQQLNFSGAVIVALLQSSFLILIILLFYKYLRNIHEPYLSSSINNKQNLIIYILRFLLIIFITAPIIALLYQAINFEYLQKLLALGFIAALGRSFFLAIISIIFSLIIIFLIINKKNNGRYFILCLTLSPVTLGSIFLLFMSKSYIAMLLSYLIMLLPLMYYLINSAYEAMPVFFTETLVILGANQWQKIKAQIKYLTPAILKSIALSMALILGDISIANLLSPIKQPTAMSLCYSLMGSYRFSLAICGMSIILLIIVILITFLLLIANYYDAQYKKFER